MLPQPSFEYLTDLVRKCRNMGKLHACTSCLHAYAWQHGMETQTSLGNLLVSILVESGSLCKAHTVFDILLEKKECSCNALINGYIKHGELRGALTLYQKMSKLSLQLTDYTCVSLLKACASLNDVQTGLDIHARMGSLENNRFVATSLIDMYAKSGMLAKAQGVFDKLPTRDVVSWNALIAGYAQHDHGEEALNCFEQMQTQGFSPDAVTFACTLKACGMVEAKEKGEEIHAEIKKTDLLESNIIIGNALIDMYAKCGLLAKAQEVFDMLHYPNVISWTALLAGYAQHDKGHDALECFEQMIHEGVTPDAATFACCLKACSSIKAADKGIEIHADIERRSLIQSNYVVGNALVDMYAKCGLFDKAQEVFDMLPTHDVVSWTALIDGYCQHEHGEEALECFKKMQSQGVPPNAVTFSCVLKACGSVGALEKGIKVHTDVEQEGLLKTSPLVGNTLVDMYAKCGMLAKARELFDKLRVRDVVSWTVLLTGYAQLGEVKDVFCLFDRMNEEGIKPNSITFISILNACSHAGLVEEGQIFFEVMSRVYDINSTVEHDTCIVDLLCRAGQLERAVALMKQMRSHPNIVLWLTVLGACRKWGNVELGCHAFEQAVALDEKETSAYVSLCNIYVDAGMQEDAKRVEQMGAKFTGLENVLMMAGE